MDWLAPFRRGRAAAPEEAKDSRAGRLIALAAGGRAVWSPRDYGTLAREGFGSNPIAYRCTRMVAEAAASVPLVVLERGARVEPGHPLQRLTDCSGTLDFGIADTWFRSHFENRIAARNEGGGGAAGRVRQP
jgi:hypothetical protein